ncbi:hypothetical protein [Aliivibrio wodanis]|uniref:hypothetical protein n=1 Tax=Aliivibrio wodanis TaxID=80852 RepID=UPI00406CCAF7
MSKKCNGCDGFLSAKALLCRYCLRQDPFWKERAILRSWDLFVFVTVIIILFLWVSYKLGFHHHIGLVVS